MCLDSGARARTATLALWIATTGCGTQHAAPATAASTPDTLRRHVDWLAALDPPRSHAHPPSLEAAASYIAEHLRAAGGVVSDQRFEVGGAAYRNVLARFGPETGPRLVVGAHYDVAGDGPGADDNASGVAVLLALAAALGVAELEHSVELVAYALEEPPHFGTDAMGSAHHAQALADGEIDVMGMISLEMLGYYSDRPGSQRYPLASLAERFGDVGDFVAVVGRPADRALVEAVHEAMAAASPLRVEQLLAPPLIEGVGFSDHRNYWAERMTAVMLTDTAFFRNPHYHETTDTPATLDFERMAQAARGVEAAVLGLAGR